MHPKSHENAKFSQNRRIQDYRILSGVPHVQVDVARPVEIVDTLTPILN